MSGRIHWRAAAEMDLTDAYLYIGAESPVAAERLLDAVGDALSLLLENPNAGSPRDFDFTRAQGIRSWAPREFPNYLIFYRSTATTSRSCASSTERGTCRGSWRRTRRHGVGTARHFAAT